jgi:crotonobetainyl-CoA:carnitine CoA-transferase CaiB-like acyl-CoA transferase
VALGKRSVVLDLTDPSARATVMDLARTADILIESFDPGVMERLGLGYESMRALNPGLVYVSVTPWGQDGPRADWPAAETTVEAAGGLLGMQGDGDRPPVPVGYPQAAFHGGAQAATDAVIALNERARSGLGQHLDVSMQAAMVWTLMNATGYPPNTGGDPPTGGEGRATGRMEVAPGFVMPNVWRCKDGWVQSSITLAGLGARTLANLLRLIEDEGELSAERQGTGWTAWTEVIAPGAVEAEHLVAARDEIAAYFERHTREELADRAVAHKLLVAPIRPVHALLDVPQLQERGYWEEIGGRTHPGPAVRLSRTPMRVTTPAPRLGEHQADIERWLAAPPPAPFLANGPRRRAFEGLKVADFAWVGVGPIIAKALADHGATVVHIESAARPDVLRLGPPFRDGQPGLDRSQFFANFNSSKRGIAVNLALPQGREMARRLADWADVVVESFTPGVARQLGLDYPTLAANCPELIMVCTCLCGQTGRHASYRGFGTQGAALAGLHGLTGWPDRPPAGTWGAYTDFIAPRYGVAALAAAILERNRSGHGQHIDLAQVEAGIHFVEPLLLDYVVNGRVHGPAGHESDRACPHGVYRTAGVERFVALAVETQEQWRALLRLAPLGHLGLGGDANLAQRLAYDAQIDAALEPWLADQDPWEAAERLAGAGVPAYVVQRPSDLYHDPQLTHRGFFVTCEHSVMGPTPYDGPVTLFSETPAQLRAAPAVGEHTDEVLRDLLHLDDDLIAEYAAAGVFS